MLVVALVWFGGLGFRKLIKPDEGRYAEIPREMVASGDWLTPRLNGLAYFEKPPLQYWTTAVAYEAFGIREWTSRLWTALTGFLGIGLVGWTAAALYDRRTGVVAATIVGGSLAYVLLGHFNTLDMGLTFFLTATVCAVLRARDADAGPVDAHCGTTSRGPSAGAARRWMLVAWAALALATLSKGPVAVVLAGGGLVVYLAWSRDWALLGRLQWVRGLALFVLIAGPWFVAVSKANPSFAHFFFVHEHVERFLTTEHRRSGPPWYFVPVLVVGLLPWITLVPRGVAAALRAPARGTFRPERLLLSYAAVVFVFFSASGSKLPSYVLPVFPALALLVAPSLVAIDGRALRRHLVVVAAIAAVVIVAFPFVPLDTASAADAVSRFRIAATVALLPWLVGTVVAIVLAGRRRIVAAVVTAGFAALVGWCSLLVAHETVGRGMSTYDLANAIRPRLAPDTPIYSVGLFEHSLDFYLQRTVTPVSFRDELDFGLSLEPDRGIPTIDRFLARWNADRAPLAVMAGDVFATLSAARVPMVVVARDERRVVVAKPSTR